MSKPTTVRYERRDDLMRVTLTSVTNHELREVLVGLWARLDAADRENHIRELVAYHTSTASWLSPIAVTIMRAGDGVNDEVDLRGLVARGGKIRP